MDEQAGTSGQGQAPPTPGTAAPLSIGAGGTAPPPTPLTPPSVSGPTLVQTVEKDAASVAVAAKHKAYYVVLGFAVVGILAAAYIVLFKL